MHFSTPFLTSVLISAAALFVGTQAVPLEARSEHLAASLYKPPSNPSCVTSFPDDIPVVALPKRLMGNALCSSSVALSVKGYKTNALLVDTCTSCSLNSIKMNQAAFTALGHSSQTTLHGITLDV